MLKQKREPKKRAVEMDIVVDGKHKRIIGSNCTVKSGFLSKLGIGKKRESMVCQSVDVIDADPDARDQGQEMMELEDDIDMDLHEDIPRAKARPKPAAGGPEP